MKSFLLQPTFFLLALNAVGSSACLDPQVSDEVPPKGLVLPAGSTVPSAHDDPIINQQIADNDGVDGTIPLLSGFADGAPTRFWDFGEAPLTTAPIFLLIRRDGEEIEFVDHKTIIDAIPGDPGYSPFWAVLFLEVTDKYNGELITSFSAIEEAQAAGLVYSPSLPTFAVNCPAVALDVDLDVGDDTSLPPPSEFFWQGKTVKYYDLGIFPITGSTAATESSMLVLSREGESPLSEPLRNVDITGDGDIFDTNNLFSHARSDDAYSPLTRTINVTLVNDGTELIDSSGDQAVSDITRFSEVFDVLALPERVIAFEVTEELRNQPQQSQPGGL